MRKIYFISLIIYSLSSFAQKEDRVWCFPDSAGIDFNDTANPVVLTSVIGPNGLGYPLTNQCSIADSSGNLFCYAAAIDYSYTGLYVFDRNNNIMPNGSHLQGHPNMSSLLLPYPEVDSFLCLFHFRDDP